MTDLQQLLDQVDRLDQQASEAPWHQGTDTFNGIEYKTSEVYVEAGSERMLHKFDMADPDIECDHAADAEFIALSREALPKLSKAVRAVLEECKEAHKRVRDGYSVDEHREGQAHLAELIQDAITDVLGDDHAR